MNFEYNKVQEISRKIWVYQYYELYQEFSADRLLPGPLLPIHYLARNILVCINKFNQIQEKKASSKPDAQTPHLNAFEYLNMKKSFSLPVRFYSL